MARILRLALLVPVLCILMSAMVSRAYAEDDWKAQREQLFALVQARVTVEVNRRVNPEELALKYNLGWPVEPPTMTVDELRQHIDRLVELAVEKMHPIAGLAEIEAEARKKFVVFKRGDQVEFTIRGGVGMNTLVTGTLRDIGEERIRVGNRWVLRSDMAEKDLPFFYQDAAEQAIASFITSQSLLFNRRREAYAQDIRSRFTEKLFKDHGYVFFRRNWTAKTDLFETIVRSYRQKAQQEVQQPIEEMIFTQNGYILRQEPGQAGEWMPKSVMDRLQSRLHNLIGGGGGRNDEKTPATLPPDADNPETGEADGALPMEQPVEPEAIEVGAADIGEDAAAR